MIASIAEFLLKQVWAAAAECTAMWLATGNAAGLESKVRELLIRSIEHPIKFSTKCSAIFIT